MPLKAWHKTKLSKADPSFIASEFSRLVQDWQHGRWLKLGNRYAKDCASRLQADTKPGRTIVHRDISSYIAASTAIHCVDGWSYLARAIEAEISGDVDTVRHLAYYAELRGALSLLAHHGIGVFDRLHIAVGASTVCEHIDDKHLGTHTFAWEALKYWATQQSTSTLLLKVIKPGGKSLSEWLNHYPPTSGGAVSGLLAEDWLLKWGLDLSRTAKDRISRNESSYRPTTISRHLSTPITQTLDFVQNFWSALTPSGINPFIELDRHLLKRSLAKTFYAHTKKSPKAASTKYETFVSQMLHRVLPTGGDYSEAQWKTFLFDYNSGSDSYLLGLAEGKAKIDAPENHLQIIARATLLLRMSTGANRELLQTLGADDREHLDFWLRSIGESRGLWKSGQVPPPYLDLWQDIEDSLDDLKSWRASGQLTKNELFAAKAQAVIDLSSCERVPLWNFGK